MASIFPVIRAAQIAAMEQACLLQAVLDGVRQRHAGRLGAMAPDALRRWVAAGVAQARARGLVQVDDIVCFLGLVLAHGGPPDAMQAPRWIVDLLHHPLLNGAEKIRQIEARLARDAQCR